MLTNEELLNLMLSFDDQTKRIPPGIRFIADAVQKLEREDCAKVCEDLAKNHMAFPKDAKDCAEAIRSRGK